DRQPGHPDHPDAAGRRARLAAGRAQPARLPAHLAADRLRLLRAGVLPAVPGRRHRRPGRHRRRPGRPRHRVHRLRRAGAAGRQRHERRRLRLHDERLLQAEVREDVRRDALDAARAGRHRGRRDPLGPAARHALLGDVPAGDGRARADRLMVGAARAAGHDAHRAGVRRGRDGGDVVHAGLAGLRVRPAGDPADVPVLDHVLPAVGLPAAAAAGGAAHPAVPRDRAGPTTDHRGRHRDRPARARPLLRRTGRDRARRHGTPVGEAATEI
ncbi:MAG: Efflux ABC transporter, permease protein, partial [uncultured Corynebacteriales bacterium]